MRTSDTLDKFATAMSAAQAEMKNAAFDKENPHFKSRYATLAAVRDTVAPVLSKHGLSVVQTTDFDGGAWLVQTRILHTSGQWVESVYPFAIDKPQQMGSALTYARRYSLSMICGIASEEDDDGNEAQKGEQRPASPLTPRNSNGTAAQPLKREEARTLFKTLQGLLTTCNSDREVMQFEHDNAVQIALLGDWKVHFDNAIVQHREAIAATQGKAA